MKRVVSIILYVLLLGGLAYSADLKIGYVDLQKALNESEGGKKAKNELEGVIKSKQVLIDEKGKDIERLKEELGKQSSVLSADALKSKQNELDRKMRDYQRYVQDAQDEVKKKEFELTKEILLELKGIVDDIGKNEKYLIILEKAEGVVLYADTAIDITERVIKRYNDLIKTKK